MKQTNNQTIDNDSTFKDDWAYFKQALEFKPSLILLSIALIFTFQYYFGKLHYAQKLLKPYVSESQLELWSGVVWCGIIFILYALMPILLVKVVLKENLREYGLSFEGLKYHWKPYLFLYLLMACPLYIASLQPAFRDMYPFIKSVSAGMGAFIIWELAYGLQFFAVEFLFRGFILFGLKEKFGWYSLFIMAVPYCMIHFGKPMGESIGAIFAGIFLGYLALKSRSIYGGVLLHWMIAFSMDALAILNRG